MSHLIGRELVKSLVLRYQSEIQSAKATSLIYLIKPVGVGEHPQHLDELDLQIQKIAEANDKLEALSKVFPDEESFGS